MAKLKFQKMWEGVVNVFDIDVGSIKPILTTLPKASTFGDKQWFYYCDTSGVGGGYYEEGEMQKAKAAGLKCFLDDDYVEKYFEEVKDLIGKDNPLDTIRKIDVSKLSNEELKKLITDTSQYVIRAFGHYLACQPQCVLGLEEKVQADLAKIVPQEKVLEIFTLLSTPTATTTLRKEEIEWLNLLVHAVSEKLDENHPTVQEKLKKHQDLYHLLHLGDGANSTSHTHFLDKFNLEKNTALDVLKKRLDEIQNSLLKIESVKKDIINKNAIPQYVVKITDLLAEIGHQRLEMRINAWMPVQYYNELFVFEVARRFKIPESLILYASYEEILAIFDEIHPDIEILKERKRICLMLIEDGNFKIYAGNEAKTRFDQLVEKTDLSQLREFKGNVAMKGKVTGIAIVFRWGDDIDEKMKLMKDDSILIAGQTRPQLMPLITKSKGIVTDEGGITSHAAIVSRELGIPCVIGTKIGTLALKTGDKIEVDAEKGIVRKL